MSTFLQMQDEVLNHGFGPAERSRVKDYLNLAQEQIARRGEVRDLLTSTTLNTVAGTATAGPLPSDLIRITSVVIEAEGLELRPVHSIGRMKAYNQGTITRGKPTHYGLADKTTSALTLSPVPDAAYALRVGYIQSPTALAADADVSQIPAAHHQLMVFYALSRVHMAAGDPAQADAWRQTYNDGIHAMLTDRHYEVADPPLQIPGTWERF